MIAQPPLDGFEDDGYERRKERARRDQANQSRKGRDIAPLPEVADPDLVAACEHDLRLFCESFFRETFYLGWSEGHLRVIERLQQVVREGGEFALAMPRSSGKTSLVTAATLWAVGYGHRRFIVVVGATSPKAQDFIRNIKEAVATNVRLGECFPAMCYPVRRLQGQNNRAGGQLLNGELTSIEWTKKRLRFPRVDGAASSQIIVHADGLMAEGIRGLQLQTSDGATLRPSLLLLDDPQSDKSAKSPAQTAHRLRVLNGSLRGLGGPDRQIAMLCPCTVIQPGDLADQLLDREKYPEWRGEKMQLLQTMPSNMQMWQRYKEIREDSLREHGDIRDATEFYRENREAMDEGCIPSWPERFEGHQLSAIQYAMDLWSYDEGSFLAEYQNTPRSEEETGIETLKAAELLTRCDGSTRGDVPEWAERITAFIDIQQDVLLWMVVAWGKDLRGRVIDYGAWPEQRKRYWTLRELQPTLRESTGQPTVESAIEAGLSELCQRLLGNRYAVESDDAAAGRSMGIEWLGVDANWELSKEIVYQASRRFPKVTPYHGRFVGGASLPMAMWKRKPGERAGHFWRSAVEQGSVRVIHSDINSWKTLVCKRLKVSPDGPASITWFGNKPYLHELLCDQLSAEYAVRVSGRGRKVDEWKNRPGRDNHWWDCLVGSAVGASVVGGALPGQAAPVGRKRKSLRELGAT